MKYCIFLMNRKKQLVSVFVFTLCSLFVFSCDWKYELFDYKIFAYDLQGVWETNGNSDYSGTLVIGGNTITIGGYAPNTVYELTNGTGHRPFRDFTKDTPLEGYTEEGKIVIKDAGIIQEGIPYTYWDDYPPPDYKWVQFLRFNFGGRVETLQKQ